MNSRMRRIEHAWNLDGPLRKVSMHDIIKWVGESGYTNAVTDVHRKIKEYLDNLYLNTSTRKTLYVEYNYNGAVARMSSGYDVENWDFYMELWHRDTMVMYTRLDYKASEVNSSDQIICLMAYCLVYTSMKLLDKDLLEDSVDRTESNYHLLLEEDKLMLTKVFQETFKGHKMFAVWKVDKDGEKVGSYPLISVGYKKAAALAAHAEELTKFVEDNKTSTTSELNTSKLSEDERSQLMSLLNKMS